MARKSALIKVAGSIQDLRIKLDYGGDQHAKRSGIKNWRFFKLLYLVGNESVITQWAENTALTTIGFVFCFLPSN